MSSDDIRDRKPVEGNKRQASSSRTTPSFVIEAAEEVFQRSPDEKVKIIERKGDKKFNIELTTIKNGQSTTTRGDIDLDDVKEQDPALHKELERTIKIYALNHFMRERGRNVSDIKIVNGEYRFKEGKPIPPASEEILVNGASFSYSNENGQETKLTEKERKAFEGQIEGYMSSFGFDIKNLDVPRSVENAALDKAKDLSEDNGGGYYDSIYDYVEKEHKWYLEKDGQITEVNFQDRDQNDIVRLNSAIKYLNLENQLGEVKSIKPVYNNKSVGIGYTVTDAKGMKHEYRIEVTKDTENQISRDAMRRITEEVKAGTLGDGPLTREEKRLERDDKEWESFVKMFDSPDQLLAGIQTDEQRSWMVNYIENRRDNQFARRRAMLEVRPIGKAGEEELKEMERKVNKVIESLKNSAQV